MKTAFAFFVCVACTLAHGQQKTQKIPIKIEQAIKAAVREKLKDPASAIFGEMFSYVSTEKKRHTCGTVNAKNSYGGYGGDVWFASVQIQDNVFFTYIDKPSEGPSIALELCNPVKIEAEAEKRKIAALIESKAICKVGWSASTPGECGELYKKCNSYLKQLSSYEQTEFMTHCRQSGYDSATEKWYVPQPIEVK